MELSLKIYKTLMIREIHSNEGIITDSRKFGEAFYEFYSSLFNSNHQSPLDIDDLPFGNTLSNDQSCELSTPFSNQEIILALHDIAEDKIPKIYEFNVKIFTHYWSLASNF